MVIAIVPSIVSHTSNWTTDMGRGYMGCIPKTAFGTPIIGATFAANGFTLVRTWRSAAPRGRSTVVPVTSVATTIAIAWTSTSTSGIVGLVGLIHSSISPVALMTLVVPTDVTVAIGSPVAATTAVEPPWFGAISCKVIR